MCGRFSLISPEEILKSIFQLNRVPVVEPRYNVAPTEPILAVRLDADASQREMVPLRWGLVPFWAKDLAIGVRMINARSETIFEKPSFRNAIKSRRCLIPADGFYEWQGKGKNKQPYCISRIDQSLMVFAGLWERWKGPEEIMVETCTIITTNANETLQPLHDRMPVLVDEEDFDLWLDANVKEAEKLNPLFRPYDSEALKVEVVDKKLFARKRKDNMDSDGE